MFIYFNNGSSGSYELVISIFSLVFIRQWFLFGFIVYGLFIFCFVLPFLQEELSFRRITRAVCLMVCTTNKRIIQLKLGLKSNLEFLNKTYFQNVSLKSYLLLTQLQQSIALLGRDPSSSIPRQVQILKYRRHFYASILCIESI